MFGTDRSVKSYTLTVRSCRAEDQPRCTAWGFPGYTTEADVEDTLGFELTVSEQEFKALRLAAQQNPGAYSVSLAAQMVDGFYADWSPGINTREVKYSPAVPSRL
jgi:hypothetical protein